MKEAIVAKGPKVTIHEVPVPVPNDDQVLIKVVYSGSNPKDWKVPLWRDNPHNSGDDIAGIVESVGANVVEFKKGDRVAAFHEMFTPNGSFAEYAIAWAHTTFHLPKKTSFEEGATIPLAAMTAAVALYVKLALPVPWKPALEPIPLIIYGGSSAVGAFGIKLAQVSNIHPLIVVAGSSKSFVETLITPSRGDKIVDYRSPSLIEDLRAAIGNNPVHHALDAVSEHNSFQNISTVLAPGGTITVVLPNGEFSSIPSHLNWNITSVGVVHKSSIFAADSPEEKKGAEQGLTTGGKEFGLLYYRLFARGLQEGWFSGHPFEVVPGGLGGVEQGLAQLQEGKVNAKKMIFEIAATK